jgi:hypothetical protein
MSIEIRSSDHPRQWFIVPETHSSIRLLKNTEKTEAKNDLLKLVSAKK